MDHRAAGQDQRLVEMTAGEQGIVLEVRRKKHTLHIPKSWVPQAQRRVHAGRQFQDAVREVLAANAQLLALTCKQRRPLR